MTGLGIERLSDDELRAIAEPIMDRLMAASTAIDYDAHVAEFTERARAALPREAFRPICEHYQSRRGFFSDRSFVALFRRPDSVAFVWRQRFTEVDGDYVAEMVLVPQPDGWRVDHAMVF